MSESTYWRHPCRVRGKRFPSIAEAARQLDLPYTTVHSRLRNAERGYKLLPYDGMLPSSRTVEPVPPHIFAEGNWYTSQWEAGEALGVSQVTISNRIADDRYPDYWVHLFT